MSTRTTPTTIIPRTTTINVKKYFPIKTDTACQSKWAWSTIYLNRGTTHSCHRASTSELTTANFNSFHNTPIKLEARRTMLAGQWPSGGCEYCQGIEQTNGYSDRLLQNSIPNLYPPELDTNPTAIEIDPTILEVFFDNTCNLSCLYCFPEVSSKIASEYNRFGPFNQNGVVLQQVDKKHIEELAPAFWDWMSGNFHKLRRLHYLGGEPFLQKQLSRLFEFINDNPNPQCELNLVSNLQIPHERFVEKLEEIKKLLAVRKLKRLDITASIDCWGPEQEYVRSGMTLTQWIQNFEYLLSQRWITVNINQTISALTIKSMPELISRLNKWRTIRSVGHYFSVTEPGPSYLRPNIFGKDVFDKDFNNVLSLMNKSVDPNAYKYMQSIAQAIETHTMNITEMKKLFTFLNEKDRRNNTSWRETFSWLTEFEHVV